MRKRVILVSVFAMLLSVVLACTAFAAELPFKSMKEVKGMGGYLYEAEYEPTTDENYAMLNSICQLLFMPAPGCTSVRKGNLYGRNFDFFCDRYADIIVRTKAGNGRYASIMLDGGMLGRTLGNAVTLLNPDFCTKARLDKIIAGDDLQTISVPGLGEVSEGLWLTLLPYVAMDGINEKGVVCNINVAQSGEGVGLTTGTNPEAEKEMYVALLPRYILDNFATAKEAVEEIQNFNIWASVSPAKPQTEYHIMIADAKDTYVVEFRDNNMLVKKISDKPYMTNFNLLLSDKNTVSFDMAGHVIRPTISNYAGTVYDTSKFDRGNGHGVDRYDTVANGYASVTDKKTMRALLDAASYGQLYYHPLERFDELVAGDTEMFILQKSIQSLPGYSDFVFDEDMWGLTLKDATEKAAELCAKYQLGTIFPLVAAAADVDRVNITPIHTIHSCIYDISAGKVWIKSQELGDKEKGAWKGEYCLSVKESSSSSGCNAGFGILAMLLAVPVIFRKKK